jgi:hypothetical protein
MLGSNEHADRRLDGPGFIGQGTAVDQAVTPEQVSFAAFRHQALSLSVDQARETRLDDVEKAVFDAALLQDHLIRLEILNEHIPQERPTLISRQSVEGNRPIQ